MMEVIWMIEHHNPCLAHIIFDNMRQVATQKKKVVLPYPRLVSRILHLKKFQFGKEVEKPFPVEVIDNKYWDKCITTGTPSRRAAFESKSILFTHGLILGGEPLPSDFQSLNPFKRRALEEPVPLKLSPPKLLILLAWNLLLMHCRILLPAYTCNNTLRLQI
jgi:hypothetical protein